jgi:phosphatidylserine decarboxylase
MGALISAYLRLLSSPSFSRQVGRAAEMRLPGALLRALVTAYSRFYGVDLAESAEPVASFRTFDEFFTRRLYDGARPVDPDPDVVCSPCDARVQGLGRVQGALRLEQIKGRTYALAELLGEERLAARLAGGVSATLYLSPGMYHRVHWPTDARVLGWRRIPGRLYPVNALAVRYVDRLFAVNQRVVVELESEAFGSMVVVLVGATNVGRISLAFESMGSPPSLHGDWVVPARRVDAHRGGELGIFHLGSTVVLLASDPRLSSAGRAEGELVKAGQALWRRA